MERASGVGHDSCRRELQVETAHLLAYHSLCVCVCVCQVEGAEMVMTGKRHGGSGVVVEERHRILQLLLSQKRVITLLQERAFPQKSVLASYGGPKKLASADMSVAEADALLANYSGDFNVTLSDADKQGMSHTLLPTQTRLR